MATAEDQQTLIRKMTAYVSKHYKGTGLEAWQRAFNAADRDHDGRIDEGELERMLSDAGVGNFMTVGAWAEEVLKSLDTDGSDGLTFPELARVLVSQARGAPPVEQIGSNAMERLNNAIAGLDVLVMRATMPQGTKDAVRALTTHWAGFWRSNQRAFTPEWALGDTAASYIRWYTRAWLLCPPDVQRQAVRPDQIDASWTELAKTSVDNWQEGKQDAVKAGKDAAAYAAKNAGELARELAGGLRSMLILIGIGVGCFYVYSKR